MAKTKKTTKASTAKARTAPRKSTERTAKAAGAEDTIRKDGAAEGLESPTTRASIINPVAERDKKATRETTTTRTVPAEEEQGEITELTIIHVNIVRDPMIKIAAEVFEHELPILEALNGEDNVEVVSEETVEVENFDVVDEYDRLKRKYRKLEQSNFAEVLGRSPRKLAKQLGIKYEDDATTRRTRRSQALIKDGGRATLASAPTRAKKGSRSSK